MNKILTIVFAIIVFCNVSCRNQQHAEGKVSREDSLKVALGITDSIKIIKVGANSIVSIDYNKHSIFHDKLLRRRGNNIKREEYDAEYFHQQKSKERIHLSIPKDLLKKWYQLYKFDNELYVYMDCSFEHSYETSDSTFITYRMEGAFPDVITRYEKSGNLNRLITSSSDTIEIEKLSDAPVFRIKHDERCGLYTPSDKINNFNIIVHHCSELTDDIVEFEANGCE